MPYKNSKYKRFKSKKDYDKYQAYIHLHGIPHTKHQYVEIKQNGKYKLHKVSHSHKRK